MEVAVKRVVFLSCILLAFGLVAQLQPVTKPPTRTEKWMQENLPMSVGNYSMLPSAEDPMISYRMSEGVYNGLKPYGIVARVFAKQGRQFDTVVVAANDRISLHDPHDCMPAQDMPIQWERSLTLNTKTRGPINAMLLELRGAQGRRFALYTFRGPTGTFAMRDQLFWNWFMSELKGVRPDGALMRVMTTDNETSEQELEEFAADWFDEAYKISKGTY